MKAKTLDARGLSRARGQVVDRLVLEIARAMADGQWVPGRSHAELAEREGVTVHAVKDWAADAGRLLRLLDEDDAQTARATNRATLRAIVADARRDGDHGAAVRGVEAENKLLGLNAPEKHQHAHTAESFAGLSDAEMLERVETQIAELQELHRKLLAKGAVLALPAKENEHE